MGELTKPFPKPTAQVAPWFDVLGPELTVRFLLTFGGAELHLAKDPRGGGRLEALVGYEKAKLLAARDHLLPSRVPLAKPWVAAALAWEGHTVAEIARRLHVTDTTVRGWLKKGPAR